MFKKTYLATLCATVLTTTNISVFAAENSDNQSTIRKPNEVIVVTGQASRDPRTKLESSVAITTKSEAEIEKLSPLNLVDLISQVPGFWAESSGGESGAGNVFVRGLPQDGGFVFLQQLEDGLPILNEPSMNFLPVDAFAKIDLTIDQFEAVRGGSASVFATGSPGGMINLVTKNPTDFVDNKLKFQIGDYGHTRMDFVHSGPLSDEWGILIGGFLRQDDGVRDPGFTANKGYQMRVKLARNLERGKLSFDYKRTDDNGIFYLPIPVSNPNPTGGNPGGEVNSFPGTDGGEFTATSADFRLMTLRHPGSIADRTVDLQDGIGTDTHQFTMALDVELRQGWALSGKIRYLTSDASFLSGISISPPIDAQSFIDDQVALAQALGAGNDPRYNGTNGLDLSQVAGAKIQYTHSGAAFDTANQNGNGVIMPNGLWDVRWDIENWASEWRLSNQFGDHAVTFGTFLGYMEMDLLKDWMTIVHDVKMRTELVDVIFTDAAGNEVAPLTDNGVLRYGTNYDVRAEETTTVAFFAYDEWQVTDALRLDFGFRWDELSYEGSAARQIGPTDFDGNAVDSVFLATDGVLTTIDGTFDDVDRTVNELSYSIGGNYSLNDEHALFARYSVGYDLPKSIDTTFAESSKVKQMELGYKLSTDQWSAFIAIFSSEIDNQIFNDDVVLPDGSTTQLNLVYGSETDGIEAEATWVPTEWFDIQATATLQDPQYKDFDSLSGNQIRRIPEEIYSVTPTFYLGENTTFYVTYFYGGERVVDFENFLELPSYETWNAGLSHYISDDLLFRIQGFNLTDELGLTEGNPRGTTIGGTPQFGDFFLARPILGRHFRASITWQF